MGSYNYATALGNGATVAGNGGIALGYGATTTAANQLVIGSDSAAIQNAYIGNGVTNSSPSGFTLQGTGGSGSNITGASITLAGGTGTGSGSGGNISFQTAKSDFVSDFISTGSTPRRIAIDDNYIYWSDPGDGNIGRANLDGTGVDNSFVTGLGGSGPSGLTVDSNYIYWTQPNSPAVSAAPTWTAPA